MSWTPSIRQTMWDDFEIRLSAEGADSKVQLPAHMTDGSYLGANELMDSFWRLQDQDQHPELQEAFLRAAALRGQAFAMMILGEICLHREHDDEAWRWYSRAQILIEQAYQRAPDGAEGEKDLLQMAIDAERSIQICLEVGANPDQPIPDDIGSASAFLRGIAPPYCLTCGKLKDSNETIAGCAGQKHLRGNANGSFVED